MIRFRNRRATLLPSTLTFALLCQAGLAFAQSPEGWPFEEKPLNPAAPANPDAASPPSKSAVQQRLEELYRRDNRPLPDYMRKDAAKRQPAAGGPTDATPAAATNPTHAAAQQASHQQALQQQAPQQQAQAQPVPAPYYPAQPPAPLASPYPIQESQASQSSSQQSIRQQLAEYYASQGKTMPGTRPTWNSAETPRQPVALDAGQGAQSGSAAAATPQQPLIERLNPFRGFWHKDDSQETPAATASSSSTTTLLSAAGRLLAVDSDHAAVLESRELRESTLAVDVLSKWRDLFEHAGTFGPRSAASRSNSDPTGASCHDG